MLTQQRLSCCCKPKQVGKNWQALRQEYQSLQQNQQQREAQRQLLEYQVAELDQFSPAVDEYPELEAEHQRLSHSSGLIASSQLSLQLLYEQEDGNAFGLITSGLLRSK